MHNQTQEVLPLQKQSPNSDTPPCFESGNQTILNYKLHLEFYIINLQASGAPLTAKVGKGVWKEDECAASPIHQCHVHGCGVLPARQGTGHS